MPLRSTKSKSAKSTRTSAEKTNREKSTLLVHSTPTKGDATQGNEKSRRKSLDSIDQELDRLTTRNNVSDDENGESSLQIQASRGECSSPFETATLLPMDTPTRQTRKSLSNIAGPRTPTHKWHEKKLKWYNLMSLGAYWFGWTLVWVPMFVVIIPKQTREIVCQVDIECAGKGSAMGQLLQYGSVGSLIFSPLFGALSDRSQSKVGRRRPFIAWGAFVTAGGLFIMMWSPPFWLYCMGFVTATFGQYISMAPYAALLPDVVPHDQIGIASGYLGGCSMVGSIIGGIVSYNVTTVGYVGTYLVNIVLFLISSYITVNFVPEVRYLPPPKSPKRTYGWCNNLYNFCAAFRNNDFRWVFISRFFIQVGSIIVQENLQWYLQDTTGNGADGYTFFGIRVADNEAQAVSLLFAPLLVGGCFSAVASGIVSDMWGGRRKWLVYFSGICMAVCCFLFGINHIFTLDVLISLVFGFGYGTFSAIDWALATDVLPSESSFGRDMGLWNLAFTLPQLIAAPLTGGIMDSFRASNRVGAGWFLVFLISCICFTVGTFLVRFIKHVH